MSKNNFITMNQAARQIDRKILKSTFINCGIIQTLDMLAEIVLIDNCSLESI